MLRFLSPLTKIYSLSMATATAATDAGSGSVPAYVATSGVCSVAGVGVGRGVGAGVGDGVGCLVGVGVGPHSNRIDGWVNRL